jgi:hypothetical protein
MGVAMVLEVKRRNVRELNAANFMLKDSSGFQV